jgi:hypothetical protein
MPDQHTQDTTSESDPHTELLSYVDWFCRRAVQEALTDGQRDYWIRRAETFEAVGNEACDETARACRARATLTEWGWGGLLDD